MKMPKVFGEVVERPSWDDWALDIALAVSKRADCSRRQVGAVALSEDHRVLGTGYNGLPAGKPGCLTDGACPRGRLSYDELAGGSVYVDADAPCYAIHAEENLILYVGRASLIHSTVYVTDEPCFNCQRLLMGCGAKEIVWRDELGVICRNIL